MPNRYVDNHWDELARYTPEEMKAREEREKQKLEIAEMRVRDLRSAYNQNQPFARIWNEFTRK